MKDINELAEERLEFRMLKTSLPSEYGHIYLKKTLIVEFFIVEQTSANNKVRMGYLIYKANQYLKFHSRIFHYLLIEYKVGKVVKALEER